LTGMRLTALLGAAVLLFALSEPGAAMLRVGYIQSNENQQVLSELTRTFSALPTGAPVELVPFSSSEGQRMLPQWLLTGEKADVFYLPVDAVAWLKNQGLLAHLDGFRWQGIEQALAAFSPGMVAAYSDARGPIGIPLTASVDVLQYNETLLGRYGVPPLSQIGDQWTWHEFVDIGRRVSEPDRGQYFVHLDLTMVLVYFLVHGNVTSPDGRSSEVNTPFNAGILAIAQEAIHRDRISPPPSRQQNTTRLFREGRLALRNTSVTGLLPRALNQNNWLLSTDFTWDVVPYPRSPFTHLRPALGMGSGLVVAQGAPLTPEIVSFITFAASAEGQRAVARSGHALPAMWQLWPELFEASAAPPQNKAAFLQAIQNWQHFAFPQVPAQELDRLAAPLVSVLEGALAADVGLARAHQLFNELLQKIE